MTDYYDLVLGVIPAALVGITAALMAVGLELTTAVPLASIVSVSVIGHAMFVRTPTSQPAQTAADDVPAFNAD